MYIYGTHQRNKYILGSMAVVVSFINVDDNYSFDHTYVFHRIRDICLRL